MAAQSVDELGYALQGDAVPLSERHIAGGSSGVGQGEQHLTLGLRQPGKHDAVSRGESELDLTGGASHRARGGT